MNQRLEIEFDKFTNHYVLWRHFIDPTDKLYPITHSFIECTRERKEDVKLWAKTYYPELYNQIKFS